MVLQYVSSRLQMPAEVGVGSRSQENQENNQKKKRFECLIPNKISKSGNIHAINNLCYAKNLKNATVLGDYPANLSYLEKREVILVDNDDTDKIKILENPK